MQEQPENPFDYFKLGNTLSSQGKLKKAIGYYQKAVQLNPNFVEAYYNMGNAFVLLGYQEEALFCYQKTIQLKPDAPDVYNNIGNVLYAKGKLKEAVIYYHKAIQLNPDFAMAYNNMGNIFQVQGQLSEAITYYKKALALNPFDPEAIRNLFLQLQKTCDWQMLENLSYKIDGLTKEALANGKKAVETPIMSIRTHVDPSKNYDVAKSWIHDLERRISNLKMPFSFDDRKSSKTKISIGYLSNNFHNHPMAHLMVGLFGLHNRNAFNINCYSYGKDDGSYYRKKIKQDCDKFVDICSINDADAAKQIFADKVDILIDLVGFLKDNRLGICALRPAPVQVRYLGFAGTTGANFFDYIITDKIVTPEDHAPFYSEKFVYMPHCYQINDHKQPIAVKNFKKSDLGLPEDSFVFCSFNTIHKIKPEIFDIWIKILKQVPKSVLWLLSGNKTAEKNLKNEAEMRGLNPDKLIFAKRISKDEHLARLKFANLVLDTRISNGAASTSDALWAGVPVLTIQGSHFASRMSSSILMAIGLPELIKNNLKAYEALAVQLALNPDKLQVIRNKIIKNRLSESLFDTPRFIKNLEHAYKTMWNIYTTGEKPQLIDVKEP